MSSRAPGPPPVISGFSYIQHLGSGGFADVFLFKELWFDRPVAVKVLSGQLSEDTTRQFTDEANLMARLSNHPSIVTVYRAGISDDARPYLVMEYCSQPNLDTRYRTTRFTEAETLSIGIEIAGAVETVHRAGILHRDIKPANILTTDYDRRALTDFGIAATIGTGAQAMSVPWSPPESFAPGAPGDERSDIYSLAATLYTLLAGHTPFETPGHTTTTDLIHRIQTSTIPPINRADVSTPLQTVLARAMAKEPTDRYTSATQLARALQRVQADLALPQTRLEVRDNTHQPDHTVDTNTQIHQPVTTHTPTTHTVYSPTPPTSPTPSASPKATPQTILKPPIPHTPPPPERKHLKLATLITTAALLTALLVTVLTWQPWRGRQEGAQALPAPANTASQSQSPAASVSPSTRDQDVELNLPVGPAISSTQFLVPRYKTLNPPGELWLVDSVDPDASRQLDATQNGTPYSIGISPDRRTLTYVDAGKAVRAMPAAGGRGRKLFDSPAGCGRINHKSWSSVDLSVFVLECQVKNGPRQLIVVDINGDIIQELETGHVQPSDPVISPDGTTIAFCGTISDSSEEGGSIYLMPIDGSADPRPVTESPDEADSDPAWSPDGGSLAFRRRVGPPRGEKFNADNRLEDTDIMTVSVTGGTPLRLVTGSATDVQPAWSPDGSSIVFVSNRDADGLRTEIKDLWLVSTHGGQPTPLGLMAPRYATPTWTFR